MDTDLHLWFFNNLSALLKGNAYEKLFGGGPGRDRTADTQIFNLVLLPAELPAQVVNTRRKRKDCWTRTNYRLFNRQLLYQMS